MSRQDPPSLLVLVGVTRNAVPGMVLVCYGLWLGQYALSGLAAPEKGLVVFETASAVHRLPAADPEAEPIRTESTRKER